MKRLLVILPFLFALGCTYTARLKHPPSPSVCDSSTRMPGCTSVRGGARF
jgi:hypothetical protein